MNPISLPNLRLQRRKTRTKAGRVPAQNPTDIWSRFKSLIQLMGILGVIGFGLLYIQLKKQTLVFNYTNIPHRLTDSGYNEELITRTVNDLMTRILNYEGELRIGENTGHLGKTNDSKIPFSAMSSLEISRIDNMSIEGVPFRTLITLTDKMLGPLGAPVDNYVSLEFYFIKDSLNLAVQYKSARKIVSTRYHEHSSDADISLLCLEASKFLLGKTNPTALAKYYFSTQQFEKCIRTSLYAVNKNIPNENRSMAFYYMAYATHLHKARFIDDAILHNEPDFDELFKQAANIDTSNYYARDVLLRFRSNNYENELWRLIKTNPKNIFLFSSYIESKQNQIDPNDFTPLQLDSINLTIKPIYETMLSNCPNSVTSDVHWSYGRQLKAWGSKNQNYFDSAIFYFNRAIQTEQTLEDQDLHKISEYHNAIAFACQQKAISASALPIDNCFSDENHYLSEGFSKIMDESHYNAHIAIMYDSTNRWAWSTLAEYYALKDLVDPQESNSLINNSINALQRAYELGFDFEDFMETEPYCHLNRSHSVALEKIKESPRYYSGKMKELRLLGYFEH